MRIGFDARKIADFGIGTYIRGLLHAVLDLRTGDTIVAFARPGTRLPEGVEHVEVDAPHYSLRELITLGRAADRANLDVFHAPHYVVPATRVPLVVTIHDLIHLHQPQKNPLAPIYARVMLRRAVRNARQVLTVSQTVQEQLERELGARDVIVTPNGIDPPPAEDPGADATVSHPGPFFLFVGNDKPHKNVETLLSAFAEIHRERASMRLVLAGGDFARLVAMPGVERPGFVPAGELSRLYRSCVALVMPSLEEGFGLPAAEAMAHGAAVITSTAGALVEVTGDAALHVAPLDERALRDAMIRILDDDSLRRSLAAKGVDRVREFTWRRCAKRTIEAWKTAANRGTAWNKR